MSQLQLTVPVLHVAAASVAAPISGAVVVTTSPCSPSLALAGTSTTVRRRSERGLVSAEWAMAIIAAVAIVGVLVGVLTSGPVQTMLSKIIVDVLKKALELL